jgi:hypothetical protein
MDNLRNFVYYQRLWVNTLAKRDGNVKNSIKDITAIFTHKTHNAHKTAIFVHKGSLL